MMALLRRALIPLAIAAAAWLGYRALSSWLTTSMIRQVRAQPGFSDLSRPPAPVPSQQPLPADFAQALSSAQARVSGLDLILSAKPAAATPAPGPSAAQVAALRQASLALVDGLRPLLDNPMFTSRLSPRQARDYRQLQTMLNEAEADARSSRPADFKLMARRMKRAQQLSLDLMGGLAPKSAGAGEERK